MLEAAANLSGNNFSFITILAALGVFAFFVLYFVFTKIKGFTDNAQVSKDLAEKYFYNIREITDMNDKSDVQVEEGKVSISVSLTSNELDKMLYAKVKTVMEKIINGKLETKFKKITNDIPAETLALAEIAIDEPTETVNEEVVENYHDNETSYFSVEDDNISVPVVSVNEDVLQNNENRDESAEPVMKTKEGIVAGLINDFDAERKSSELSDVAEPQDIYAGLQDLSIDGNDKTATVTGTDEDTNDYKAENIKSVETANAEDLVLSEFEDLVGILDEGGKVEAAIVTDGGSCEVGVNEIDITDILIPESLDVQSTGNDSGIEQPEDKGVELIGFADKIDVVEDVKKVDAVNEREEINVPDIDDMLTPVQNGKVGGGEQEKHVSGTSGLIDINELMPVEPRLVSESEEGKSVNSDLFMPVLGNTQMIEKEIMEQKLSVQKINKPANVTKNDTILRDEDGRELFLFEGLTSIPLSERKIKNGIKKV